jgi:hypothetical protein
MPFASFAGMADHLAAVVVVARMLFLSVLAYRPTRMSAFLCLICGSLIFIGLAAVLRFYKPASREDPVLLMEWSHVGHFAATILCGIGICQLVGHARREFERKSLPNKPL